MLLFTLRIIIITSLIALPFLSGCTRGSPPLKLTDTSQRYPEYNSSLTRTEIDMDGDTVTDYVMDYSAISPPDFKAASFSLLLGIKPLGNNQIFYIQDKGSLPMSAGIPINDNLSWERYYGNLAWTHFSAYLGWDSFWSGPWANPGENYLAVKFKSKGSYHYGWLKLQVNPFNGEYMVLNHAYNSMAGGQILAGFG